MWFSDVFSVDQIDPPFLVEHSYSYSPPLETLFEGFIGRGDPQKGYGLLLESLVEVFGGADR